MPLVAPLHHTITCSLQLMLLLTVNVHCCPLHMLCNCSLFPTDHAPSNYKCSLYCPQIMLFLTGNVHFTPHHIYAKERCPLLGLHDKSTMTPNIFNTGYNALRTKKRKKKKEKKNKTEILTLQCWVQSHITTYFNMSTVGFARQTNTDTKRLNAGFNAHALSNCKCLMLSTAHALSNSKSSLLSTADALSNWKWSQHSHGFSN